MTTTTKDEQRRIERLVRDGKLSEAEGRKLVAALTGAPRPWLAGTLADPFRRLGGEAAAAVGLVVALASMGVAQLGVRFDGFLDLHKAAGAPGWGVAALDQLVAWVLPALLFAVASRLARGGGRPVDFLGMTGLSRVPTLSAAILLVVLAPAVDPGHPRMTPRLLAFILLSLPCVVWNLVLLYQGFRNAAGLGVPRARWVFVVTAVAAELGSKLVLSVVG